MRLSIVCIFRTMDCVSKTPQLSFRPSQMNPLFRVLTRLCLVVLFLSAVAHPARASEARTSPQWVHEAVVYEIFTRNFSASGDFNGVTARLPELKNLGVTVL